jgi:hypothetical protein
MGRSGHSERINRLKIGYHALDYALMISSGGLERL